MGAGTLGVPRGGWPRKTRKGTKKGLFSPTPFLRLFVFFVAKFRSASVFHPWLRLGLIFFRDAKLGIVDFVKGYRFSSCKNGLTEFCITPLLTSGVHEPLAGKPN